MTPSRCSATCCGFAGTACGGGIAEAPAPRRRLIINADDFGLSVGVNRGILEAYAAGGITSTSLLANGPAFEDAVASLHRLSPAPPPPGVGLHFNLTAGEPLAPPARIPSLCDRHTSGFVSLGRLVRRALTGRLDPSHVASECRAQLARIQGAGVTVTHIDSHRHVHALPCVWEPVVAVARSAGTRVVRVPVEPPSPTTSRPGNVLKQLVIAASWRIAARRDRGLLRPDHFRGIGLLWAADFAGAVLALVDRLPAGTTELMVHPGYASAAEIEPWDDYVAPRERELAALCSPAFRDALARCGVTLIDFTRL